MFRTSFTKPNRYLSPRGEKIQTGLRKMTCITNRRSPSLAIQIDLDSIYMYKLKILQLPNTSLQKIVLSADTLPNYQFLDWSKLKAFADDKINITQIHVQIRACLGKV